MIRVKICCISSIEEARMAINAGANALGLVSSMPSGPGVISEEQIAEIAVMIPPGVASFLLTSKQDIASIIAQQKGCKTNTIQITDKLSSGSYNDLRDAMPGIRLVQVVHVIDEMSIREAEMIAPHVDAILLDSGNQRITNMNTIPDVTATTIKELGGTGRTHDWTISKKIRDAVGVPIFLAGGLNPSNVRGAIEFVQPFGVDICSGVRTDGKLDKEKLKKFFVEVKNISDF